MTRRIRFSPIVREGVLAAGLMLAASSAGASDVPFTTQPPISTAADGARSVFVADVDGDGDLDILSASYLDDKLAWYENLAGNGTVFTLRSISTTADGSRAVSAADVDGDGDLDAVSASYLDDKVAWYENTAGNGTAWTLHTVSTAANGAVSVFAADVDQDGDLDLLSASSLDDKIAWYENTLGNGTAWSPHTISTAADGARSVFAVDVDGDGDVDALSASATDGKVAWYENTAGDGSAFTLRTISTTAGGARSVFAADVDDDGDQDVLSASFLEDKVAWYENTAGNGTAWVLRTISTAADGATSAFAADVDGDGDLDVLSASVADDKVAWYENSAGNGTTWIPRTVATGADAASSVFAADVDGDGDLDVLSASFYDDKVAWYRNDTIHASACFGTPPPISTAADRAYSVFAADVDGDGDNDALSASRLDGKVAWYENTVGNGTAWTVHTIITAVYGATSVLVADVDGDGDMDGLSASGYSLIAWYENTTGNGTAWTLHTITTAVDRSYSVFAADVDGDGDMDVLAASFYSIHSPSGLDDGIVWCENTAGNGTTWTLHTFATGVSAHGVFAADVDGDGDTDALSASEYTAVAWYENTAGDGSAWILHTIPSGSAVRVFAADVDGDGDMDALSASDGSGAVAWYENAVGNGTAWIVHTITTAAYNAFSVFAADVEGDGDLDALSASALDDKVAWYENAAGNGTAWTLHTITVAADGAFSVFAADVDGDGDVDALSASLNDDKVAWYRNRGGQFSLAASDLAPPGAVNGELVPMLSVVATHLGRGGDGDMELSGLGLLFEEAAGDPLSSAEANAVIESLRIYRDANGNGVFDPAGDVLVATVPDLVLTNGIQTVSFSDGDANVQVSFGTPRTYFVVTELTANASQQTPNQFRVTHLGLGASASTAEDRTYDIALRAACPADVSSSVLPPITPVQLQGFTVE